MKKQFVVVKRKFLPALAALLVMLIMLPSAAGAEDTPVTATEIAGTWNGDAVLTEDALGGQSPATVPFSLTIAEDGTGAATLSAASVPISFKDGVISGSRKLGTNVNTFHAAVSRDANGIVIEGEWELSYSNKSGRVVYAWTASGEGTGGAVSGAGKEGPDAEDEMPVLTGSAETAPSAEAEPEATPFAIPEFECEDCEEEAGTATVQGEDEPWDGSDPWTHAGPLATVLISELGVLAATLGGAAGTAASAVGAAGPDSAAASEKPYPPIDTANVPDYPAAIKGSRGEIISKKPGGTIEARYPGGNVVTRFPNGTVQVRQPDGYTWEEWPDGTVSASENGVFVTQTPDGTMTVVEKGEETVINPDGTSVETNSKGVKIARNESGEVVSAEKGGYVMTRDQKDPDTRILTSPYGGSVVVRNKQEYVYVTNEKGRPEGKTVEYETYEGEMRTKDATFTFKPDGSRKFQGDDGTYVEEHENGSVNAWSPDGTDLKYNAETGDLDFKFPDGSALKGNTHTGEMDYRLPDGSYAKANTKTGEIDAKLADGSFWKQDAKGNGSFDDKLGGVRGIYNEDGSVNAQADDGSFWKLDAKGNGSFDDKQSGVRGVCREDGAFKMESKDGSVTQQADGTIKAKVNDGTTLTQEADGTVTLVDKNGVIQTRNPDGTGFMRKPDGTVSPLPPLPR